jgi:membrane protein
MAPSPNATRQRRPAAYSAAVLRETYQEWREDRAIRLGAGLAYYALFAAVPVLSSAIAIAGLVFSEPEIQDYVAGVLTALFSEEVRQAAEELAAALDRPTVFSSLTLLSVLSGMFVASLVFVAFQDALNVIWKVPVTHGLRHTVRRRLVAFSVVLLAGALLVASLLVHTISLVVDNLFPPDLDFLNAVNDVFLSLATWGLGVSALALLFKLLVRIRLAWRDVVVASAITGALLIAGTWGLGLYFRHFSSLTPNGVAGSLLIALFWLYYEAQIIIGGAELLKVLDRHTAASTEAAAEPPLPY